MASKKKGQTCYIILGESEYDDADKVVHVKKSDGVYSLLGLDFIAFLEPAWKKEHSIQGIIELLFGSNTDIVFDRAMGVKRFAHLLYTKGNILLINRYCKEKKGPNDIKKIISTLLSDEHFGFDKVKVLVVGDKYFNIKTRVALESSFAIQVMHCSKLNRSDKTGKWKLAWEDFKEEGVIGAFGKAIQDPIKLSEFRRFTEKSSISWLLH